MRSKTSILTATLAFAAAALCARTTLADPLFPAEIQKVTGGSCPPPCTICHDSLLGGPGTVHKDFGEHMFLNGLDPSDPGTVATALSNMEAAGQGDTDGDGVSDRDELKNDTDPNQGGKVYCGADAGDVPPTEVYGCGARIAPPPGARIDALAAGLAALLALALGRAARRRH